jgi:hypothetical protein
MTEDKIDHNWLVRLPKCKSPRYLAEYLHTVVKHIEECNISPHNETKIQKIKYDKPNYFLVMFTAKMKEEFENCDNDNVAIEFLKEESNFEEVGAFYSETLEVFRKKVEKED